ncbi:MAG TPA: proline iminopeptidase-family hydrolase [Gaiellaceae bacterium]|nr:proline iminopeptidase-family hydrolase [Gaiellaceae bacterium]
MTTTEGRLPFREFETWYRVAGDGEGPGRVPLLVLHGGPGGSHDPLEGLGALAEQGRRVVFYDQLGGGDSDKPDDPSLWTVETFLEQLRSVRERLGLERLHLFGSSWGGMLALEYALTRPEGLTSLVLNSTPTSAPRWAKETRRLRDELPQGLDDKAAPQEFWRRHICRIEPEPEALGRTRAKFGTQVYETMWGPNEFTVIGTLKEWDVIDRLGEIEVPTLITSGRHDECTLALVEPLHRGIAGSEWVLFERSSHTSLLEEPERYLEVIGGFLARVESQASA